MLLLFAIAPVLELETMEDVSFQEMMVSRDMAQSIRTEDTMTGKVKTSPDGKPVLYSTDVEVKDGKVELTSVYSSPEGTTMVTVDVDVSGDYDSTDEILDALANGEEIDVEAGSIVITNDSGDTVVMNFSGNSASLEINGQSYENVNVQGDIDMDSLLETGSASFTMEVDGQEIPVSLSLVDPDTGEPVSIDPDNPSSLESLPSVQITLEGGGNCPLEEDIITYIDLGQLLGI